MGTLYYKHYKFGSISIFTIDIRILMYILLKVSTPVIFKVRVSTVNIINFASDIKIGNWKI